MPLRQPGKPVYYPKKNQKIVLVINIKGGAFEIKECYRIVMNNYIILTKSGKGIVVKVDNFSTA